MKTKKASSSAELKTAASRRAEQLRTRCNQLSDSERRELMDEGMRQFYGTEVRPARAHRR